MAERLCVECVIEDERWRGALGEDVQAFAARVLGRAGAAEAITGAVTALFADDARLAALKGQFLGVQEATNVLAFPAAHGAPDYLGDIALARETIEAEAARQGKRVDQHAAHLLVHGFLHLLGYDHDDDGAAARMEAREREILAIMGWPDPYAEEREQ